MFSTILLINTGMIFVNTVMLGVLVKVLKELVHNEGKRY